MHLLSQIRSHAAAEPNRLAMVFNNEPVTYDRFWRLIDGCRRSLEPHAPPGGLALVSTTNLLDNWVINLALRGLGCDTAALPDARQTALFADRPVAAVITVETDPRPELVPPPGARRLTLSAPSRQTFAPDLPLPALTSPTAPGAHVMLTSGVTGSPKPVATQLGATAASLRALSELAQEIRDPEAPPARDTVVCLFDLGLWTTLGYTRPCMCWSIGAAVVFDQRGPHHLALEWPGVTHVNVTPFYLRQILSAPESELSPRPELRLAVAAGALTEAAWRETCRRLTSRIFINVGSTEAGLWARSAVTSAEDLLWQRVAPDRVVQVVDEADQPLPAGEVGRVRVGLRRLGAAETGDAIGQGWVYPGDLGVMDEQNRISLRGRATDVISIEGVKYPTAPWERQLQDRLGCETVCVMSGRFGGDREELHVFLEGAAPVAMDQLVAAVRSTLVGFDAVQIHRIDVLPRTPLGKIRRVALAQRIQNGEFAVRGQAAGGG